MNIQVILFVFSLFFSATTLAMNADAPAFTPKYIYPTGFSVQLHHKLIFKEFIKLATAKEQSYAELVFCEALLKQLTPQDACSLITTLDTKGFSVIHYAVNNLHIDMTCFLLNHIAWWMPEFDMSGFLTAPNQQNISIVSLLIHALCCCALNLQSTELHLELGQKFALETNITKLCAFFKRVVSHYIDCNLLRMDHDTLNILLGNPTINQELGCYFSAAKEALANSEAATKVIENSSSTHTPTDQQEDVASPHNEVKNLLQPDQTDITIENKEDSDGVNLLSTTNQNEVVNPKVIRKAEKKRREQAKKEEKARERELQANELRQMQQEESLSLQLKEMHTSRLNPNDEQLTKLDRQKQVPQTTTETQNLKAAKTATSTKSKQPKQPNKTVPKKNEHQKKDAFLFDAIEKAIAEAATLQTTLDGYLQETIQALDENFSIASLHHLEPLLKNRHWRASDNTTLADAVCEVLYTTAKPDTGIACIDLLERLRSAGCPLSMDNAEVMIQWGIFCNSSRVMPSQELIASYEKAKAMTRSIIKKHKGFKPTHRPNLLTQYASYNDALVAAHFQNAQVEDVTFFLPEETIIKSLINNNDYTTLASDDKRLTKFSFPGISVSVPQARGYCSAIVYASTLENYPTETILYILAKMEAKKIDLGLSILDGANNHSLLHYLPFKGDAIRLVEKVFLDVSNKAKAEQIERCIADMLNQKKYPYSDFFSWFNKHFRQNWTERLHALASSLPPKLLAKLITTQEYGATSLLYLITAKETMSTAPLHNQEALQILSSTASTALFQQFSGSSQMGQFLLQSYVTLNCPKSNFLPAGSPLYNALISDTATSIHMIQSHPQVIAQHFDWADTIKTKFLEAFELMQQRNPEVCAEIKNKNIYSGCNLCQQKEATV